MINTTLDEIVFNHNGEVLNKAIRECLRKTAIGLLEVYRLSERNLENVSTKTEKHGLYSKLVLLHVLKDEDFVFDEDYVRVAFLLYKLRVNDDHKKLVYKFLISEEENFAFRAGYIRGLSTGIGPFLIALHSSGSITLPISFNWPRPRQGGIKGLDIGKPYTSELLAFIRSLESQGTDIPDQAFSSVGTLKSRRESPRVS